MSQIQAFILAIGGFQGFLLFTLLISDKRVNYASKLLGVYCLLLAATLLLPLIVSAANSNFSWLIGWLVFLPASYGALSYLYCRTAMTGSSLRLRDIVHLSPLLICYILNYEILFSAEKALDFVSAPQDTLALKLTLTVSYGQALLYGVLLIMMIYRFQKKAKQNLSSYNPDTFKWHWCLVVFIVLIWSLKALSSVTNLAAPMVNFIADCLLVILIYFFAIAQWRKPSLFHVQQLQAELSKPDVPSKKTLTDGLLDENMRSSVLSLVKKEVEEHRLYRNNKLTLASLAEQVGISLHHLSETLNQHGGKNFNQFINEYRVAEVCKQLDENSDRKLIDMAMDAGFSSKSSFNAIFKKVTGKPPTLYRQQQADR
ncbi:helix-turn-helix domain-containing protein [Kangiella koreensis]|uniref:Transcriptional regulator, AraC family n=1 Tax=Kangiella koreensis (strain DSM 16069 / JCM 12317 / KCTC 12182 / SW-125) TaxID=523791 RepID=C7RBM5_KANKD|nr:helix-turn-helix domain-containing protein [Kangiella koreensis]ACV26667.1 transcriptional regulator, AraC family [Kangiella koreensis DSM 16069]